MLHLHLEQSSSIWTPVRSSTKDGLPACFCPCLCRRHDRGRSSGGRWTGELSGSMCDIIVMSCLFFGGYREIQSPIEIGIGATWLAAASGPVLLFCPDELNDEEAPPTVPLRRPADLRCPSLSRTFDRQCCGLVREAKEMLKIGCQCVSFPSHLA